jgi:hypothetical protein
MYPAIDIATILAREAQFGQTTICSGNVAIIGVRIAADGFSF